MTIYAPGQAWEPGKFASILAIGDSWFWYPNNNLLQSLSQQPRLRDPYRNIQSLGFNGAALHEYVLAGKYAPEFRFEMQHNNSQYYSAVLVSGAGNDAVEYHLALKPNCRGISEPKACLSPEGLDALLKDISGSLTTLIHDVSWEIAKQNRTVDIIVHGYDYPVPDGRGFELIPDAVTLLGPWLKPAMDRAHVMNDMDFRKELCRLLVDELNTAFQRFDGGGGPGYRVHYVDSRGTLDSGPGYQSDWANELHPTPSGFDKIVGRKWLPVLQRLNYAT